MCLGSCVWGGMSASSSSLTSVLCPSRGQIETSPEIREMALWSRSDGKLTLTLERDLLKQTDYFIKLIVQNPTSRPTGGDQEVTLSATLASRRSGMPCTSCGLPVSLVKVGNFSIVQPSAAFYVERKWYECCSTAEYIVTGAFSGTVLADCTAGQTYIVPIADIDPDTKIVQADSTSFTVSACDENPLVFATVAKWSRTSGLTLSLNKTILEPDYCGASGATPIAIESFTGSKQYTLKECLNNPIQTLTPHKVCFKLEHSCPSSNSTTLPEPVCVADALSDADSAKTLSDLSVLKNYIDQMQQAIDMQDSGTYSARQVSAMNTANGLITSNQNIVELRTALSSLESPSNPKELTANILKKIEAEAKDLTASAEELQTRIAKLSSQNCEFITASITQSNPYPCHLNTLTVSFSTSKKMKKGTKVTMEGLTGTNTVSTTTMRISGASVAAGSLEGTAEWKQTQGIIAVVLGKDMQTAGDVYSFSFEITNPSVEGVGRSTRLLRGAATVRIYANNICKASSLMQNDKSTCLFSKEQIYGARPGDAAPLVVLRPKMMTKKIGQSSPFAGCVSFAHAMDDCASV